MTEVEKSFNECIQDLLDEDDYDDEDFDTDFMNDSNDIPEIPDKKILSLELNTSKDHTDQIWEKEDNSSNGKKDDERRNVEMVDTYAKSKHTNEEESMSSVGKKDTNSKETKEFKAPIPQATVPQELQTKVKSQSDNEKEMSKGEMQRTVQSQNNIISKLEAANKVLENQLGQVAIGIEEKASIAISARNSPKKPGFDRVEALSRQLIFKEKKISNLSKKIEIYKKSNSEIKKQLEKVYNSELLTQLENNAKDKERKINDLVEENRTLLSLQRNQEKRIQELEGDKDKWPVKLNDVVEELRVNKEKLRKYKEKERIEEARSNKIHQQIVDLGKKNKELNEELRKQETTKPFSPVKIEEKMGSQKDEIDKLKQKISVLENAKKLERNKYEKAVKTAQDQIDNCKEEMEKYHCQLVEKEKEIRLQVLQVKKLKRGLRDLIMGDQANQEIFEFLSTPHRFQGPRSDNPSKNNNSETAAKKTVNELPTIASSQPKPPANPPKKQFQRRPRQIAIHDRNVETKKESSLNKNTLEQEHDDNEEKNSSLLFQLTSPIKEIVEEPNRIHPEISAAVEDSNGGDKNDINEEPIIDKEINDDNNNGINASYNAKRFPSKEDKTLDIKAEAIQTAYRRHTCQNKNAAAVKVQAIYRGHATRNQECRNLKKNQRVEEDKDTEDCVVKTQENIAIGQYENINSISTSTKKKKEVVLDKNADDYDDDDFEDVEFQD